MTVFYQSAGMKVPTVSHCVLFLLFVWNNNAARDAFQDLAVDNGPDLLDPIARQLRTLISSETAQTVCGSGEITELLQSKKSQDIRTTQWGKIKAIALDYLKNKDSRI